MDKFHVYLLIDPTVDSQEWQDKVFYIGKGKGLRAQKHELEEGNSAKVGRIQRIREAGSQYEILYATWSNQVHTDPALMSGQAAYQLEAALIAALRPTLTNKVSGHHLTFQTATQLESLRYARPVNFPEEIDALLVSVMGLRGGTDTFGMFTSPDAQEAWENIRRWWDFGRGTQAQLRSLLENEKPVALIGITAHNMGYPNVVVEIYQIADFFLEKNPGGTNKKVVFERVGPSDENQRISYLREELKGNVLCIDERPMVLRQRRITSSDLELKGYSRFKRTLGPGFRK